MIDHRHLPRHRVNGHAHYERLSREVVRLDRSIGRHRYHRRGAGVFRSWRRLLTLIGCLVLFWLGVALLLGWRPA